MIFSKVDQYKGPSSDSESPLPVGRCRVTCDKDIGIAYLDADKNVLIMFVLQAGTHTVHTPPDVQSMVECDKFTKWSVYRPRRFDPFDPTRVSAALVRPRSQKEEMQAYVNELIARTQAGEVAQQLRSGNAELDITQDSYDDDDDDYDSPLSVHQMTLIMDELQYDLQRAKANSSPAEPPPEQDTPEPESGTGPTPPVPKPE